MSHNRRRPVRGFITLHSKRIYNVCTYRKSSNTRIIIHPLRHDARRHARRARYNRTSARVIRELDLQCPDPIQTRPVRSPLLPRLLGRPGPAAGCGLWASRSRRGTLLGGSRRFQMHLCAVVHVKSSAMQSEIVRRAPRTSLAHYSRRVVREPDALSVYDTPPTPM